MTYDKIIEEGKNPYLTFNSADQELIDSFQGETSFGGNLARGVFQAKKRLLTHMGLTDTHPLPQTAAKCPKVADTSPGEPSLPVEDEEKNVPLWSPADPLEGLPREAQEAVMWR